MGLARGELFLSERHGRSAGCLEKIIPNKNGQIRNFIKKENPFEHSGYLMNRSERKVCFFNGEKVHQQRR